MTFIQKPLNLEPGLHERLVEMARSMVSSYVEREDGGSCFNLFTYMKGLENAVAVELAQVPDLRRLGIDPRFAADVARYLWVCVALEECREAYPKRFWGMPVLD